ncbi:putative N(4)-(beta-N-acetylglucosaminyl)-L-asparaginase GA14866 [Anopheles ziemanni]|uniref:putative N(4)-(beta-N-acetylglucosaminyl)-L-asparaginase GA14866 n=1 Tax=Anopheles coustani TaxID=139045 RepID=UPI00265938C0|nr:putative N(4)-(beta-N-acetylglucosaminyl)-L-asparaginase GA14866 [Anopheles coustani]XP_058171829.1 putative N(4)-(beta-N-acetylglucosaminyl)-L-asparaginase GA14866 [Anopheles ziemanni]
MLLVKFGLILATFLTLVGVSSGGLPLVATTWAFKNATLRAYQSLTVGQFDPIDALVEGCSVCEREQCDFTVGYGGSPDENGETTLDAMLMDGTTMDIGAVAALREVKHAAAVAKYVLQNTKHTLLVGSQATEFALMMGFKKESLQTDVSKGMWMDWKNNHCQPNFWKNVIPSPSMSCGPYEPVSANSIDPTANDRVAYGFGPLNHDTISMIIVNADGHVVAGSSTNGARNKIPGRVGDSPIPGAGAYADSEVGGAVATGDGDVMMRFLPSLIAVEGMRGGLSPTEASQKAIDRIAKYYPTFVGGVVATAKDGRYGAACNGMEEFPVSIADGSDAQEEVRVEFFKCKDSCGN